MGLPAREGGALTLNRSLSLSSGTKTFTAFKQLKIKPQLAQLRKQGRDVSGASYNSKS